jgi:hypothetical protein
MKEEAPVVRRFIDYYRRIGAERIFIYFDGAIEHLAVADLDHMALAQESVDLFSCDEAFWLKNFARVPEHVEDRQRAAFALGHDRCPSDWLFVCDADEFIIARMPVADLLAAILSAIDSVILTPAEVVWGPGEDVSSLFGSTWFRRPDPELRGQAWRDVWQHGLLCPLFQRGILSHVMGKQFVRRGARFDLIHQHCAIRDGVTVSRPASQIDQSLSCVELAHFDAISFERWFQKFLRPIRDCSPMALRERSRRRRLQIMLFKWSLALGMGYSRWLFRNLYCVSPRQIRALQRRNLGFQERLF